MRHFEGLRKEVERWGVEVEAGLWEQERRRGRQELCDGRRGYRMALEAQCREKAFKREPEQATALRLTQHDPILNPLPFPRKNLLVER
jgi:hypothetical protein